MRSKKLSVGLGVFGAVTASLCLISTSAFADYAPTTSDVVGVGSDTVQAAANFVFDGDFTGNSGYNSIGNPNKAISFDATADANTRLAYSPQGVGNTPTVPTTNACAPGTGATVGTGNANSTHTGDVPCVLNPTIVLRAGTSPVMRPNGSGAGYNLLKADTDASGNSKGYVDFARASSGRGTNALFDSITIGSDPLQILVSDTTNAPAALTAAQLNSIYACSVTTWNDPAIGGSSSATIKPLLPQIGSGTRTSFLGAIGNPTVGNCVTNVEENDPEAIDSSGNSVNAIEPMSGGRLNLFKGKLSTGAANGVGGYFLDPSCPFPVSDSSTPTACTTGATLNPNVHVLTGAGAFNISRPLYLYFRHADIASTTPYQPGLSLNWVRTLFYNPCSGLGHTTGCVTVGGTSYGPGGQPFIATSGAAAAISAAGIVPTYAYTASGP
jgi:ABC-type phosphate transport system substrate-binding protein